MSIVALASAYGVGSIAVVRLGGADAYSLALKIAGDKPLTPRHAHLRALKNSAGEILDEAIVIYFKAPHSYTGEDIVEFQTHGGVVVANLIIDELLALGARAARPGEFSKIAFINGKMDAAKAESMQALITARSEGAAKILARAMSGELGEFAGELRADLIGILAHCEACIDYAEDELPPDVLSRIEATLCGAKARLDKIVEISRSRRGLIDGYKVAIVGKPNVGKSSILNAILHFERAIVSDQAGTTRDTVEEQVKIGSHLIRIIDTAGIREGASEVENIGIEYSKKAAEGADIVICVFDGSAKSDAEDAEILRLVSNLNKKVIFVLNKADLPFKFELNLNGETIKLCAKEDASSLKNALENYLNAQDINEIMLSSNRQIKACEDASAAITRAQGLLSESELELFAYEVKSALNHVGSITQVADNEEVLDAMFSTFCLGK